MKYKYALLLSLWVHLIFVSSLRTKNSKYFFKKGAKQPETNEFGVPDVPEMAYDAYVGLQRHTIDLDYNEFMPGADIVQIELGIGKALPGNLPVVTPLTSSLMSEASKIKTEENQQWRFNRPEPK